MSARRPGPPGSPARANWAVTCAAQLGGERHPANPGPRHVQVVLLTPSRWSCFRLTFATGSPTTASQQRSAIGTLVERQTRLVMLVALPDGRTAEAVRTALASSILRLPEQLRGSLTGAVEERLEFVPRHAPGPASASGDPAAAFDLDLARDPSVASIRAATSRPSHGS